MAASVKEKAVMAGLGVAALYALAAGFWFVKGRYSWEDARKTLARTEANLQKERRTISERAMWDGLYNEEASRIPVVEAGQSADTVWMGVMDEIAADTSIFITERKPGKVEDAGDMKQTTVDIRWSGAFESLVKFLYELENTDKGKFDVQSLSFSPGKRKGYLGGNMTLVCVFKEK